MSAGETLQRLLTLLPLASRAEGVELDEAAEALGVSVDRVIADVELLSQRSWYLPAGSTDDLQIHLEGTRLRVAGAGAFTRPLRLTRGELLALSVALRVAGVASEEAQRLCAEIERELAAKGAAGPDAAAGPSTAPEPMADFAPTAPAEEATHDAALEPDRASEMVTPLADLLREPDAIRDTFSVGVLERRVVAFAYLKPNADEHEVRTLEPYRLLHAEGEWYVVGRDREKHDLRLFRVDRVLGASLRDAAFEPDPDFDASELVRDGQIALITDDAEPSEVEVRYSDRVARWVAERWDGREGDGGAYVVQHPVYEERWLMRTVMRYGGEASAG